MIRRTALLAPVLAVALSMPTAAVAGLGPGQDPEPNPQADMTGPTITVTRPDNVDGWHADTVDLEITIVDVGTNGGNPSGFRFAEYQMYRGVEFVGDGLLSADDTLTFSTEGSTRVVITAWDNRENPSEATHYVGVDRTAPWVTFGGDLADGAQFALGQQVTGSFGCGDAHSGISACTGTITNGAPLYTAQPGSYTVTATATDNVGRVTQRAVTYQVLPDEFELAVAPQVTGTPRAGHVLTASAARFTPDPTTVEHQWLRNGSPIPGADGLSYRLTPEDRGREIRYAATARREHHTDLRATSDPVRVDGLLQVTGRAAVRGTPRLGAVLSLTAPSFAVPPESTGPRVALQWLRDGRPIAGARGSTYRITPADVGRRISARASAELAGWEPAVVTSPATAPVPRVAPRLTAKAKATGRGRVRLQLALTAPGVPATGVTGTAVVRLGKKVVGRAVVKRGRAVVTLKRQPRKRVTYTVRHPGNGIVLPRTAKVRVRVR